MLTAPVVIGRDHLDRVGGQSEPETKAIGRLCMPSPDWPAAEPLLKHRLGGAWVSLHHGVGVGIGYFSRMPGMVIVGRRNQGGRAASWNGFRHHTGERAHAPSDPVMTPQGFSSASRAQIFRCWTPSLKTGHSRRLYHSP